MSAFTFCGLGCGRMGMGVGGWNGVYAVGCTRARYGADSIHACTQGVGVKVGTAHSRFQRHV